MKCFVTIVLVVSCISLIYAEEIDGGVRKEEVEKIDLEDNAETDNSYAASQRKCPVIDGKNSVYIPNRRDCSRFFQCSNGVPVPQNCPKGLHFNARLNVCDYPWRAGCATSRMETEVDPQEIAIESKLDAVVVEDSVDLFDSSKQCPTVDGKHSVYLPNTKDCSRFFQCSNGVPVPQSCPKGLHFNPRLNVCDYPWRAGCRKPRTQEIAKTDNFNNAIYVDTVDLTSRKCPAVDGKRSVYLPNTKDCSRFFQCSNGVPVPQRCPIGLHFNTRLNVCDYPWRAGCRKPRFEEV